MRTAAVLLFAFLLLLTPFAVFADPVDDAIATAKKYVEKEEYERAIEHLSQVLDSKPGEPRILLELGRTAHIHARSILTSTSPSLGGLALLDAIAWYKKAVKAKPDWPEALRLLGLCAVEAGEYELGAQSYGQVVKLAPGDGESLYQHGYCLAFQGLFTEGIEAFGKAEKVLGPQARIHLNRGICFANLGDVAAAERSFVALVTTEAESGRAGSTEAGSGFQWLWRIHAKAGNHDKAEAVFAKLAGDLPKVSAPHWYLAYAILAQGRAGDAIAPLTRVTEIVPTWMDGWSLLGRTLVQVRKFDEATAVLKKELALDREAEAPLDLLFEIIAGQRATGGRKAALALLTEMAEVYPDVPPLFENRGDIRFLEGDMAEAIRDYRRAGELDPFGTVAGIKEQKAATVLLRKGDAPKDLGRLRPAPEDPEPAGEGAAILDFEAPGIYVRAEGAATGRRESGRFSLQRKGQAGGTAAMTVLMLPTLNTTPYATLKFEVKGEAGRSLLLRAKDCYDEFSLGAVRLQVKKPVILTGKWQTVSVPLSAFVSVAGNRPLPFNASRLRMLLFDIGTMSAAVPKVEPAKEVLLDNVALVKANGDELLLADFDGEPAEITFLADGVATPFARTLFSPDQLAGFVPEPSTYVTPEIMGDKFEGGMVHGGRGAFRLTLPSQGAAAGTLTFNPDRSYDGATALTFWAKGAKGGEKVRISLEDSLDASLSISRPALSPRLSSQGTLVEGWFVLTTEWKQYRIPRATVPDVDFDSLTRIRFLFGTSQGNATGTRFFLDDIRWE